MDRSGSSKRPVAKSGEGLMDGLDRFVEWRQGTLLGFG
ncbi:hypothetical protein AM1_5238 [Acaryochloris marina MBIC11017]|uniref:Uncharacterized protein n=1 Tax=Acaryochloris marina (strain MBIC 11017) TaxID=329726 RepID=B0C9Q3_ACAM1|nr:hypothetical protein AM1_5238 [Acaryochloris marina MBIC11017]